MTSGRFRRALVVAFCVSAAMWYGLAELIAWLVRM